MRKDIRLRTTCDCCMKTRNCYGILLLDMECWMCQPCIKQQKEEMKLTLTKLQTTELLDHR